jgi:Fe-S cluster assembly protein SufD
MSELAEQLATALPSDAGSGPQWARALRDAGAEQFRQHGLPSRKDEAWKYTGLSALDRRQVQLAASSPAPAPAPASQASLPAPLVDEGYQVNMLDGQVELQLGDLPTGLTVLSLADALDQEIGGLQDLLESLPDMKGSTHGFTALNTAMLNPGMLIHVAAGTDAGRLLVTWAASCQDSPLLINTRVCLIMENGAKLELLEQFEGPYANASNIVVQADIGEYASLQHVRFQQEPEDTVLITRTEITQQSGSEYAHYGFDLGGGLVRHDLHTALRGSGAKSAINGAYLLDGNRHVDNQARVDHFAPGCFSEQYFRGVAGGSGRAVFNTAVVVHPGADESEARQSNANILLSARAEIDTKPELEIYADEVIASHGATVGQLDEQAVFYMRSRGLSEHEARQLLTTAFCRSVSDKLTDPVLSEHISQRMMDVMPEAG